MVGGLQQVVKDSEVRIQDSVDAGPGLNNVLLYPYWDDVVQDQLCSQSLSHLL